MSPRWLPALSLLTLYACGSDPAPRPGAPDAAPLPDAGAPPDAAPVPDGPVDTTSFRTRASVEQIHVWRAAPGAQVRVLDAAGAEVHAAAADELGGLVVRKLAPGSYRVRIGDETSRELVVLSVEASRKDPSFYRAQRLAPGFNYIETRDGTRLSAYVTLPGPPEMGPYPTVVAYSGYTPSRPGQPIEEYAYLCGDLPALCDPPDDVAALLAALHGYATVGVNVRGTGCSGGAYDYFETLQLLDGYDVIETVAAQDWVLHNQVGMVGLSYPGITQLFVASVRPPGLAAITPLSVIGNSQTTLLPGGILNDGFAISWVTHVVSKAVPWGQGWERARADAGDTVCAENQLLHAQLVDNVAQARAVRFYDPAEHDRFNPTTFVDRIDVPVFLAGAWQDEQTGPYFMTLFDRFTTRDRRFVVYNGLHPDGFAPQVLEEWYAFLELFVARRAPLDRDLVRTLSPLLYERIFGASLRLDRPRWSGAASHEEALAAMRAEPPVRAIFENGGLPNDPGAPEGTFERGFASWPPPETRPLRLWFQPDGTLGDAAPTAAAAASAFRHDPEAGERGTLAPGADVWAKLPDYDWKPLPGERAVAFVSAPLPADVLMLGTGSVDLWLRSPVDDADLEVNLTEVRPDGQEMYVQSGWLRASHRVLGPDSTELWPSPTYLERDLAPLVPGEWNAVRIAIAGFGHVFRAGSRIRVAIDTPGDSRTDWRFALKPFPAGTAYAIGHDQARPSSVVLPRLEGVTAPGALPACPSLRGQPCRAWVEHTNTPAD